MRHVQPRMHDTRNFRIRIIRRADCVSNEEKEIVNEYNITYKKLLLHYYIYLVRLITRNLHIYVDILQINCLKYDKAK